MRVVVAEDEVQLADSLALGLRADGFAVRVVYDGLSALTAVAAEPPDVLVLDRDLPAMHGDQVCRALRAAGHAVPVLMLTAASSVADRVSGLDLGADDYLVKPFAYLELVARLRALGRRSGSGAAMPVLERGGLRMDTARRCAERDGRPLQLTAKELAVLEVLMSADGGYVSTEELLAEVWDSGRDRTLVKAAVHALRTKLGQPTVVQTAPGLGYRIL